MDRIELTPNYWGKLEINLYGDLAGILSLAANRDRPLEASDPSVQQDKVVAGACSGPSACTAGTQGLCRPGPTKAAEAGGPASA